MSFKTVLLLLLFLAFVQAGRSETDCLLGDEDCSNLLAALVMPRFPAPPRSSPPPPRAPPRLLEMFNLKVDTAYVSDDESNLEEQKLSTYNLSDDQKLSGVEEYDAMLDFDVNEDSKPFPASSPPPPMPPFKPLFDWADESEEDLWEEQKSPGSDGVATLVNVDNSNVKAEEKKEEIIEKRKAVEADQKAEEAQKAATSVTKRQRKKRYLPQKLIGMLKQLKKKAFRRSSSLTDNSNKSNDTKTTTDGQDEGEKNKNSTDDSNNNKNNTTIISNKPNNNNNNDRNNNESNNKKDKTVNSHQPKTKRASKA